MVAATSTSATACRSQRASGDHHPEGDDKQECSLEEENPKELHKLQAQCRPVTIPSCKDWRVWQSAAWQFDEGSVTPGLEVVV